LTLASERGTSRPGPAGIGIAARGAHGNAQDLQRGNRKREANGQFGDADAPVARVHHPVVAGTDQNAAVGDRVPAHHCHYRCRAGERREERLTQGRQELLQVTGGAVAQAQQIDTRREDWSLRGEDGGAVAAALKAGQLRGELAAQGCVQGVRPDPGGGPADATTPRRRDRQTPWSLVLGSAEEPVPVDQYPLQCARADDSVLVIW